METSVKEASNPARRHIPALENGDHLSAREFLRRYEAMPELKKAELIQGIVHMASPVRLDLHGKPDNLIQGWLCLYAALHPEVTAATNVTVRLDSDDVAQPDAVLFLDAAHGGKAAVDENGYLSGAPELIVEIAASSVSRDAREKLVSYRRAGVAEYLLWRVLDGEIDWFALEDDEYRPIQPEEGCLRSRIFPGLSLRAAAALSGDLAAVLGVGT